VQEGIPLTSITMHFDHLSMLEKLVRLGSYAVITFCLLMCDQIMKNEAKTIRTNVLYQCLSGCP